MPKTTGPIQQPLPGLLGLLQLKNRGQNPADLWDTVQPTIDVLPFFLRATVATATQTTAAITQGGNLINLFNAPVNEWQYVHNMSAIAALGAGDEWTNGAFTILDPVATNVHNILPCTGGGFNVGPNNATLLCTNEPFLIPPGQAVGLVVYSALAGSSFTATVTMRYSRFLT